MSDDKTWIIQRGRRGRPSVNTRRVWLAICDLTAKADAPTIETTRDAIAAGCDAHGGRISLRGVSYSLDELRESGHIETKRAFLKALRVIGLTLTVIKGRASV